MDTFDELNETVREFVAKYKEIEAEIKHLTQENAKISARIAELSKR
jgi:prefoldin subunit 5